MKRTIEISSPGLHVRREDRHLVLESEGRRIGAVPLEDLGVVITDNCQLTLTSAALEGIAECGAVLIACGSNHLPIGTFLPLVANTTSGERLRAQCAASLPLQKGLWAALVRSKILNQAEVLRRSGCDADLRPLAREVRSGDVGNIEARAAQAYWPLLFRDCPLESQPFRRDREGASPNALLNYGYAVLRACVARALVGAGLHPGLGIHHHNRYDPMPLASDVMEPFRAWVDARVLELARQGKLELDRDAKRLLLGILTDRCVGSWGEGPLALAIERTASSLARCMLSADAGEPAPEVAARLLLPEWPEPDSDASRGS